MWADVVRSLPHRVRDADPRREPTASKMPEVASLMVVVAVVVVAAVVAAAAPRLWNQAPLRLLGAWALAAAGVAEGAEGLAEGPRRPHPS